MRTSTCNDYISAAGFQTLDAVFPKDLFFYRLFRDHDRCRCAVWWP